MRYRLLASTVLALGACGLTPLTASAQSQSPSQPVQSPPPSTPAAPAPGPITSPQSTASQEAVTEVDEVVVTGIRSTLARALQLKQEAITFRDTILAEDIGKFPEQNIADALVRLPGVELVKDGNSNEGQTIRLRGLSAEFTVTTFNGAPIYATSGGGVGNASRAFNYDIFASELFGRVDIYKAPLAELTEGGIAGVVDLRTPRPFDRSGRQARYQFASAYNTQTEKSDPRGSFTLSNTWDNGWGVLLTGAASRANNGQANFDTTGQYASARDLSLPVAGRRPTTGDLVGVNFDYNFASPQANLNGLTQDQVNSAILPRFLSIGGQSNVRDRAGLAGSIQYRRDRFELSLDGLYSKVTDEVERRQIRWPIRDSIRAATATDFDRSLIPVDVRVDENNNLQGTLGNVQFFYNSFLAETETEYTYLAGNGRFDISDTLTISGQVSVSRSDAFNSSINLDGNVARAGQTLTFDTTDPVEPTISTTADLLDPATYNTMLNFPSTAVNGVASSGGFRNEIDEMTGARFVVDWDYTLGGIEGHLKAGVSRNENVKTLQVRSTNSLINRLTIPGTNTTYLAATGAQRNAYTASLLEPFDLQSFLPGTPTTYPTKWLAFPLSFFDTLGWREDNQSAPFNLGSTYEATETITAYFVQSDFDTEIFDRRLRANVGVRYVNTATDIDNNKLASGGTFAANNVQSEYDNWLPSATIAYNLRDDLVLRAAYGKTLTRAAIQNIAADISIPAGGTGSLFVVRGNPDLLPERSTSKDLGLEWYFAKGGILSIAAYEKTITDRAFRRSTQIPFDKLGIPASIFTTNLQADLAAKPDTNVEVSTLFNEDEFAVKGIEVAYQQNFTFLPAPFDGIGMIVSWTNVETEGLFRTYPVIPTTGPNAGVRPANAIDYPLIAVPKNTYAITAFYEKGPLALRASYNHKSEVANVGQSASNQVGFQRWNNDRGYLDASISYRFSPLIELRLDATNLTDTETYDFFRSFQGLYGDEESRLAEVARNGSFYTISLRGSF